MLLFFVDVMVGVKGKKRGSYVPVSRRGGDESVAASPTTKRGGKQKEREKGKGGVA